MNNDNTLNRVVTICRLIDQTIDHIYLNEINAIMGHLVSIMDSCSHLLMENSKYDNDRINSILQKIIVSVQNYDYVLVSDLLEYELKEYLNQEEKMK